MSHAQDVGSHSLHPVHEPIGTVIMYAGPVEDQASPAGPLRQKLRSCGWLVCDGSTLPFHNLDKTPSIYCPLFHVIGTIYGGDGSGFNLPDYRGYFFRGRDFDNRHDPKEPYQPRDPDWKERTPSCPTLDPTAVGSTQGTVVQSHGHAYNHLVPATPPKANLVAQGEGLLALVADASCATDYGAPEEWVGKAFKETRPINISINLLIKFTHTVGKPTAALSHLMGLYSAELSLAELMQRDRRRPRK